MRILRSIAGAAATTVLMTGCALFSDGPQRDVRYGGHERSADGKDAVSFSTPAEIRLAFLREGGSDHIYCAEPMPDVALGSENSLSGSLSGSLATTQALAAATTASLVDENSSLHKQNQRLKDALRQYEKETGTEGSHEGESSSESSGSTKYGADSSSENSVSSSSNASLNLQAAYKLAVTVSELGGRTQQVLLAREFLYRLCEARANRYFVDDEAYVNLQQKALLMIQAISTPAKPSAVAEQTALLKALTEHSEQELKRCDAIFKACEKATKDPSPERTKCADNNNTCTNAIASVKVPETKTAETASAGTNALDAKIDVKVIGSLDKDPAYVKQLNNILETLPKLPPATNSSTPAPE